MTEGIKTVIYPVNDLARAKTLYSTLLGVEPYADEAYYVGFRVDGRDIGLDPHGHRDGMTAYWQVADIEGTLAQLVAAGAEELQAVKDVGGGRRIASVKDPDGNIIGLQQDA